LTLIFTVTRRSDGVQRTYRMDDVYGHSSTAYWFREGNMACDCNRAMQFARAGDEPEPEDPPCGSDKFHVGRVVDEHGVCWYEGDSETARIGEVERG
jgi:hypothetical protein